MEKRPRIAICEVRGISTPVVAPPTAGRSEFGMYFMYILSNDLSGKHYIGSTNNLERRLDEHNRGQTKSTKKTGKWSIIYTEQFMSGIDAKRREQQVKSYKGGNAFKKLIAGIVHW